MEEVKNEWKPSETSTLEPVGFGLGGVPEGTAGNLLDSEAASVQVLGHVETAPSLLSCRAGDDDRDDVPIERGVGRHTNFASKSAPGCCHPSDEYCEIERGSGRCG